MNENLKPITNNVITLADVKARKAQLRAEMATQKSALIYGVQDIVDDFKPSRLAVDAAGSVVNGFFRNMSATQFAVNALSPVAVKSPIVRQVLQWVLPIAVAASPKISNFISEKAENSKIGTVVKNVYNNILAFVRR